MVGGIESPAPVSGRDQVLNDSTGAKAKSLARGAYVTTLLATLLATIVGVLAVQSPAAAVVNDLPDDTVQTDGRVSDILLMGGRIYLAGTFQNVNGVPRTRLAAIDANTGQLTNWAPRASGWVMTLAGSPDGTRVYAGGQFGSVSGTARSRLVALDATTGAVDRQWSPAANGAVRALAISGNRVYAGGEFSTINGEARTRLAALEGATGALAPNWAPAANDVVRTLAASADGSRIYVGGHFAVISGRVRQGLAALDPSSASVLPWRPNPGRPVIDVAVRGSRVYSAEGGAGGRAVAYDAVTGAPAWVLLADGDAQAITAMDGKVYVGGHFETMGGQSRRFFAAVDGATGALDPDWTPRGQGGGVWEMVPDPARARLYAGGDFTGIGGQAQRGFAQFSE